MQKFYFDLVGDLKILPDRTGVRASTLEEAIEQARTVIDEMKSEGALLDLDDDWRLYIISEDRSLDFSIPINA